MRKNLIFTFVLLSSFFTIQASKRTAVSITCYPLKASLYQGEKIELDIEVVNRLPYSLRPDQNFFISYHIFDRDKKLLSFDNRRFVIPKILRRNRTVSFILPIYFEYTPGAYSIQIDIVKEGEYWGSSRGWETPEFELELKSLFSDSFKKTYLQGYTHTANNLINREQYLLRIIYKNCEIYQNDRIFGFSPGSNYPQVWIRDTATFIRFGMRFYALDIWKSIIERFMDHKKLSGEIVDWINTAGATGKNTVSTDQESSLVIAAAHIAYWDKEWLNKKIKGTKIVKRLDQALDWVWNHKRHDKYRLVVSGLTADWGDVEKSFPDQRATQWSEKSIPVLSIYTQAKYIQALHQIVYLAEAVHDNSLRLKWEKRLNFLKYHTKRLLYRKDDGYFLIHWIPSIREYDVLERDILALGGNAEAIRAGLLNRDEIKRFLNVFETRRKKFKLSTVSYTLLPPFPAGFFPHPLLKPWQYQNGGAWDWIGARLVRALIQYGFRDQAIQYLEEIVRKNLKNFTIFEWEDRSGTGRGALFYVGAAGVIGSAIVDGFIPGEISR